MLFKLKVSLLKNLYTNFVKQFFFELDSIEALSICSHSPKPIFLSKELHHCDLIAPPVSILDHTTIIHGYCCATMMGVGKTANPGDQENMIN